MATQMTRSNNAIVIALIAILAVVGTLYFLDTRRPATTSERIGNAMEELGDGVEDASEELDPNRTTGEKIGDAVEDAGENIKETFDN